MIDIRVPGVVYFEALDPLATGVPEELELPDPRRVSRGKGWTFYYDGLTLWQAEEVASHLIDHAYTLMGDVYPEERAALRACVEAGQRIRKDVKEKREVA